MRLNLPVPYVMSKSSSLIWAVRMAADQAGWKDGRLEGWKIGSTSCARPSILPFFHPSILPRLPVTHKTGCITWRSCVNRSCRSAGFTLLEIILATALATVLLAALYTALQLHLTVAERGPEAVQRSQLARAVLDRIARDIRAIVPPAATSDTKATGSSNTSTGTELSGVSELDELATGNAGLLGGPDWLMLYIAQQRPNLDDAELASLGGQVAQASNIVRVTYTFASLAAQPDEEGRSVRLGIARSEVAAAIAHLFDASYDDSDYRAATDFLCDDVAFLQFQYWDDYLGQWVESWGFDQPTAPPRAVKVIISLQPAGEIALGAPYTPGSTWEPYYQMVIAVPAYSESGTSDSTTGLSGTSL